jgi:hypothetical protein
VAAKRPHYSPRPPAEPAFPDDGRRGNAGSEPVAGGCSPSRTSALLGGDGRGIVGENSNVCRCCGNGFTIRFNVWGPLAHLGEAPRIKATETVIAKAARYTISISEHQLAEPP